MKEKISFFIFVSKNKMYHPPINQWKSQFMKPKTSRSNYIDWTYVTPMEKRNNVITNYDTRDDPYESFKNYVDHVMSAPEGRKRRPKNKKTKKTKGFQEEQPQDLNPIEAIQPIGDVPVHSAPVEVPEAVPEALAVEEPVQEPEPEQVPEEDVVEPTPEETPQVVPGPEPQTQGFDKFEDYEYDTYDSEN